MKKYCDRPFEFVIVSPNGDVKPCSWTKKVIGNLLKQDLEEIWHSEAAEEFRESFRDGSLRYCRTDCCPRCNNNLLEEVDDSEVAERFQATQVPVQFNLSLDHTCNHSCPSCRQEIFVPSEQYKKNVDILVERLLPHLPNAKIVGTNGTGDMFASPKIMGMLERFHPTNPDIIISFETNGVLFDEESWKRIAHLGEFYLRVVVTPNSFERATFKALSGGHDNLDRVLKNLAFMKRLREEGKINNFAISIVSQDRNFRELPAFAQRCLNEFNVDELVIKPIYKWNKITDVDYLQKNVLNPEHPYFEENQDVMKDPRLDDPRVFWWGADQITEPVKMDYNERKLEVQYKTSLQWAELLTKDPDAIKNWLKKNGYGKVGIYGYGRMGMLLQENLGELWNNVVVAVRPSRIKEGTTYVAACCEQWPGKNDMDLLIVTTVYDYKDVYENAKNRTDAEIMSLDCLLKTIAEECCE